MKLLFTTFIILLLFFISVGVTFAEDHHFLIGGKSHLGKKCPFDNIYVPQNAYQRSHHQSMRPTKAHIQDVCGPKSRHIKDNISGSVEFDFLSKYIWRGLPSSRGFVWQPSFAVELFNLGLNVWANFPVANQPDQGEFNEFDFILYYAFYIKRFTATPSIEVYIYPGSDPRSFDYSQSTTVRLNLHLNYEISKHFDVFTDFEVDVHQARGAMWLAPGFGFHHKLIKRLGIETSILFAIGDDRFNRKHIADVGTKLNLIQYTLAFPWNVWRGLTLKPIMQVYTIPSPSLRRAVTDPDSIRGGLDIIYNF
jgi:hypothetical protein